MKIVSLFEMEIARWFQLGYHTIMAERQTVKRLCKSQLIILADILEMNRKTEFTGSDLIQSRVRNLGQTPLSDFHCDLFLGGHFGPIFGSD